MLTKRLGKTDLASRKKGIGMSDRREWTDKEMEATVARSRPVWMWIVTEHYALLS